MTSLVFAVQTGDLEAVQAALAGSSADARDSRGRTALMLAADRGDLATVRALLDAGASPNRRTPDREETALHLLARKGGSQEVARELLSRRVRYDRPDRFGWTPLMVAARFGRGELVAALVQAGAEPDLRTPDGRTARQLADEAGHADIAAELGTES